MHLDDAYSLMRKVEEDLAKSAPLWRSVDLWPLIRQCLWNELLNPGRPDTRRRGSQAAASGWSTEVLAVARKALRAGALFRNLRFQSGSVARVGFLSRPVYLQILPSGEMFDRIVDPLIFTLPEGVPYEKFYVSQPANSRPLRYFARCLSPLYAFAPRIPERDKEFLHAAARLTGCDAQSLVESYGAALTVFVRWYKTGRRMFAARKELRRVYLTSWYFPDMMGLTASAHAQGISVIDVQHGKQGRFQAMYSGWDHIPAQGYAMMPDRFWCWGQPSCDHIMESSPERLTHRPFVGGLPWLDYYRRHIAVTTSVAGNRIADKKRILVTMQPRQSANVEPVPDFILAYLRSSPRGVHFVFRCHPNDPGGLAYCKRRLASLPSHLWSIDPGTINLYDTLLQVTHHITAYSSCCYEASVFGVPTLLFGSDGGAIYADEIASGEFAWTEGDSAELADWIEQIAGGQKLAPQRGAYIISSLDHATSLLSEQDNRSTIS